MMNVVAPSQNAFLTNKKREKERNFNAVLLVCQARLKSIRCQKNIF
jgi:hypothetical protein